MSRAGVFAHFNSQGNLADYVLYSLQALGSVVDKLILVSTSPLGVEEVARLESWCDQVICRENVGYDFHSYRVGLEQLELTDYDEVLLINDSIYGPLSSLQPLFAKMNADGCDFWGLTDNYDLGFHLQSYFLVFKSSVVQSKEFLDFWRNLPVYQDKKNIVREYEIGITQALMKAGFNPRAVRPSRPMGVVERIVTYREHYWKMFRARWSDPSLYGALLRLAGKRSSVNQTHWDWLRILLEGDVPYLKVDLFRDDPDRQLGDRERALELIEQNTGYPVDLIRGNLKPSR